MLFFRLSPHVKTGMSKQGGYKLEELRPKPGPPLASFVLLHLMYAAWNTARRSEFVFVFPRVPYSIRCSIHQLAQASLVLSC